LTLHTAEAVGFLVGVPLGSAEIDERSSPLSTPGGSRAVRVVGVWEEASRQAPPAGGEGKRADRVGCARKCGAHPPRTGDLPNLAGVVYYGQQPIVLLAAAKSTSHSSP